MEHLLTSAVVISLFLILLLIRKPDKTISDYLLIIWLLSLGYVTFCYQLVYSQNYLSFPDVVISSFGMPLLQGPLIYLYIKYQVKPIAFQRKDLFHFLPFVFCSLSFLGTFFIPEKQQIQLIEGTLPDYETLQVIKLIGIYLSGVIYFPLALVQLIRFKKIQKDVFSNIEKINFNWLLYQIIGLCIVWAIILFIRDDQFIFGSGAVFILWLGYFGVSQVNVFSKQEVRLEASDDFSETEPEYTESAKNNHNENTQIKDIYQKLLIILEEEKPYLNPELKLLDLARLLHIHPNLLSKVINEASGKNFYELINEKRVEEFVGKIKNGDHQKYTIITLAYDSGFNSKASFNRNFKRITGMSPTEFLLKKS